MRNRGPRDHQRKKKKKDIKTNYSGKKRKDAAGEENGFIITPEKKKQPGAPKGARVRQKKNFEKKGPRGRDAWRAGPGGGPSPTEVQGHLPAKKKRILRKKNE